eukprot:m.50117 g.50117  ORF g.50117 m.50117 type:complete len:577 (+) comp21215_c0_seq1:245-1975(+)
MSRILLLGISIILPTANAACCSQVTLVDAEGSRSRSLGVFTLLDGVTSKNAPVYKNGNNRYLYKTPTTSAVWAVGVDIDSTQVFLHAGGEDIDCPVNTQNWKSAADGGGFEPFTSLEVSCSTYDGPLYYRSVQESRNCGDDIRNYVMTKSECNAAAAFLNLADTTSSNSCGLEGCNAGAIGCYYTGALWFNNPSVGIKTSMFNEKQKSYAFSVCKPFTSTVSTTVWFFSECPNESCDSACSRRGGTCNQGALGGAEGELGFAASAPELFQSLYPSNSGDSEVHPSVRVSDSKTFQNKLDRTKPSTCSASAPDFRRICACSNPSDGQQPLSCPTSNPTETPTSNPTPSPTDSPVTTNPTHSPTDSPTTSNPTPAPTNTPTTPSTSPSLSPLMTPNNAGSGSSSGGSDAGLIVLGVVVGVLVIAIVAYFVRRHSRAKSNEPGSHTTSADPRQTFVANPTLRTSKHDHLRQPQSQSRAVPQPIYKTSQPVHKASSISTRGYNGGYPDDNLYETIDRPTQNQSYGHLELAPRIVRGTNGYDLTTPTSEQQQESGNNNTYAHLVKQPAKYLDVSFSESSEI